MSCGFMMASDDQRFRLCSSMCLAWAGTCHLCRPSIEVVSAAAVCEQGRLQPRSMQLCWG